MITAMFADNMLLRTFQASAIQNLRKDASAQELIERDPVGANTHEDISTVKFLAPSMRPALPTS